MTDAASRAEEVARRLIATPLKQLVARVVNVRKVAPVQHQEWQGAYQLEAP
jgi:hypothetical protein